METEEMTEEMKRMKKKKSLCMYCGKKVREGDEICENCYGREYLRW